MLRQPRAANLQPSMFSTRASIHNVPMPYLQPSLSPMTVARAFSTSASSAEKNVYARGHKIIRLSGHPGEKVRALTAEEKEVEARTVTLQQDSTEDRRLLLDVILHGMAKSPLPTALEEVRQKHGLTGKEYYPYWHRAIEAKLARGGATGRAKFAHLKAQRKLQQISGRKDLDHFDLLVEAQEIASKRRREERAERTEVAKQRASTQRIVQVEQADALTGLLQEARTPQESNKAIKEIESKIESLRSQVKRIMHEKAQPLATATKTAASSEPSVVNHSKAIEDENEKTTRAIREERKAPRGLVEAESLLNEYNKQIETTEEQARQLAEIRKRKEEILTKKRALLKQLQEQEKAENEAKKVTKSYEDRLPKQADSFDLNDILDDAMGRVGDKLRSPVTQDRASQNQDDTLDTKPVEDSTALLRKVGAGSVSVVRRPTAKDSFVEETDDALADPIMEDLEIRTPPRSSKDTRPPSEEHLATMADDPFTSSFGSTNKPDPIPPNWPLLQQPKKDNERLSLPSDKKSSDNLRLHVPPTGFIPIDEDLIVSFDAPVPDLQSQVFQMQQRLKNSYPRIDTLPYDVWTSENKRTLQTWLKILVSRWQTRFDDVDQTGQVDKCVVDERVRTVLDQMVRDHDLSNEAAERMAVRWHDVFDQKGAMDGDAEGVLDWDEFHAGGMGFLTEEAEYKIPQQQPQQQQEEGKTRLLIANNKRPETTGGPALYESITRRLYSTSSQPPLAASTNANDAKPISTTDAKPTTTSQPQSQPSLPHLTSSGSAHMVSVSAKAHTIRTAIAVGTVYFTNPTPLALIKSNSLKKGDVLGVSRIAGIMAAKKCPELIPLCHPIPLTHVGVELKVFGPDDTQEKEEGREGYGGVMVEAKVQCTGPTGVEMEALTAVMGATLSIVDMCKAVDKFQRVQDVRVVLKEGGKSGVWNEDGWKSFQ